MSSKQHVVVSLYGIVQSEKLIVTFVNTSYVARTSQEIARILWNPKIHYRVTHSYPSQKNPAHTPLSYCCEIHFNSILPSTPFSSERSLSFKFWHQEPLCNCVVSHAFHIPILSNSPSVGYPTDICWAICIMKLVIKQLFQPVVPSSLCIQVFSSARPPRSLHHQFKFLPYCARPSFGQTLFEILLFQLRDEDPNCIGRFMFRDPCIVI